MFINMTPMNVYFSCMCVCCNTWVHIVRIRSETGGEKSADCSVLYLRAKLQHTSPDHCCWVMALWGPQKPLCASRKAAPAPGSLHPADCPTQRGPGKEHGRTSTVQDGLLGEYSSLLHAWGTREAHHEKYKMQCDEALETQGRPSPSLRESREWVGR